MNTPRLVMQETKKAFRQIYKKQDLNAALVALCNLKGVGPAMASGNAHFDTKGSECTAQAQKRSESNARRVRLRAMDG